MTEAPPKPVSYTGPSLTELQRRTEMLEALGLAAAQMIGDSWEDGIQSLLDNLGRATDVSRVTLFRVHEDPEQGWLESCCYDWAAAGLAPLSGDPRYQNIPLGEEDGSAPLDDWSLRRMRGEIVQANYEETTGLTRTLFEEHGTLSFISVPISIRGSWWGFIGFDDCKTVRKWSDIEIQVLRTAASLISGALARTRAEQRLKISEERYALAARGTNDGLLDWDLATDEAYYSKRLREILGLDEAQSARRSQLLFDRLHADDAITLREILENRFARHRPKFELECRIQNDGSSERWVKMLGLVLYDGATPTRIVTSIHDITTRKLAEDRLRESEERFRAIVEAVPIPLAITRAEDDSLILANGLCSKVFALPVDEAVGRPIADFYADPGQRRRIERRLKTRGAVQNVEVRLRRGDGREFWALMSVQPLTYHDEKAWLSAIIDISDFKHSEAALRDSEVLKSAIVESAVGAIVAIDQSGRIVEFNPEAELCFGIKRTDALGNQMADLIIPQRLRDAHRRGFAHYQKTGEGPMIGKRVELAGLHADGREFPIEITVTRAIVGDSEMYVAFIVDLTEKKAREDEISRQREALHQSEKLAALGTLLAGVAHELNNPLSIVVGRAYMLASSTSDQSVVSSAEKIRQAAERCAKIVKSFLAMARHRPPEHQAIQVNEMISEVLDLLDYGLRSNGVAVSFQPDPDLPEISADPDQLGQVVMNLIVNAQHALGEIDGERRLMIETRHDRARGELLIRVADNGPGVAPELRSRIFDPFYTTKPSGSGTGVGLSVSLAAVRAHHGTLSLNDALGGGACFTIALPLERAGPTSMTAPKPGDGTAPCRILVVDDEPEIAQVLVDILQREGHQTAVAHSGRQALARLSDGDYDLIMSDLRMPDLDGIGLFRELKANRSELTERMIFVTGDTLSAGLKSFLEESGCPTIEKPFAPEEVLSTLRARLACARAR